MSFRGGASNPFDETAAWGNVVEVPVGDVVKDAIKKEQVIKDILAAQEDLRSKQPSIFAMSLSQHTHFWLAVMLSRIQTVQGDIDKLKSDNATLQMYIDNLTKQMARR
ncbi:hypothetical protein CALCODRAFT_480980 [Calocera cornea HHB12733]|uniref:Uncharacterized protein n=1 Tax=Calocera cornea HHB12733 TaxID=1353952 RepID=A0A165I3I8_9BASI|nr:hypothetical protein CALCODRAFT_480980 [Calocera cornea HHB12733]